MRSKKEEEMNAFIVVIFKLQRLFLKKLLQLQNRLVQKWHSCNFYWSRGFVRKYEQFSEDPPTGPLPPQDTYCSWLLQSFFILPFSLSVLPNGKSLSHDRSEHTVAIKRKEHRQCCFSNAGIYMVLMSFQSELLLFEISTYACF